MLLERKEGREVIDTHTLKRRLFNPCVLILFFGHADLARMVVGILIIEMAYYLCS